MSFNAITNAQGEGVSDEQEVRKSQALPLVVGEQFLGQAELPVDCALLIGLDAHYWGLDALHGGDPTRGSLFPISRTVSLGPAVIASCCSLD